LRGREMSRRAHKPTQAVQQDAANATTYRRKQVARAVFRNALREVRSRFYRAAL